MTKIEAPMQVMPQLHLSPKQRRAGRRRPRSNRTKRAKQRQHHPQQRRLEAESARLRKVKMIFQPSHQRRRLRAASAKPS